MALAKEFQSPRAGKFESNLNQMKGVTMAIIKKFQSPRSGKFESNDNYQSAKENFKEWFQSPRSGKFESNHNPTISGIFRVMVSIP